MLVPLEKKPVKTLIGYKSSHVSRLMEENLETASALIGWLKDSQKRVQNATYNFNSLFIPRSNKVLCAKTCPIFDLFAFSFLLALPLLTFLITGTDMSLVELCSGRLKR